MSTMKVKPWGAGQGDHVVIDAADFDPSFHATLEEAATDDADGDGKLSIGEIRAALTAKGVAFDPKAKKAELRALLEG